MAVDGSNEAPEPDVGWTQDAVATRDGVCIPVRVTARRPRWEALPVAVRDRIETLAGGAVANARSASTGFTLGFASRLTLANGRRIFDKAAGAPDDRRRGWSLSNAYVGYEHRLGSAAAADSSDPARGLFG